MTSFTHVVAEVKRRGLSLHYNTALACYTIKEKDVVIWSGKFDDALAFLSEWDDLADGGFDD